jgi:hypothetical protein
MPQIITTPKGEELVLLPREEYERLVALAAQAEEEAADVAAYDAAMADLENGKVGPLPAEVSAMLLRGASLVSALRIWRGLKQIELAARSGLSQSYLSDLEGRRRRGSKTALEAIAKALDVPANWLV